MIRFRLKERMADLSFKLGRRVYVEEVAAATGIHRLTLGKIANKKGYNCTTDSLDRLCIYFDCRLEDIAEFVREEEAANADEQAEPVPAKTKGGGKPEASTGKFKTRSRH